MITVYALLTVQVKESERVVRNLRYLGKSDPELRNHIIESAAIYGAKSDVIVKIQAEESRVIDRILLEDLPLIDGVIALPSAFRVQENIQWQRRVEEYNGTETPARQVTAYVFVYIQSENLKTSDENKKRFVEELANNSYIIEASPIYKADDVIVKVRASTVENVNQVIMGAIQSWFEGKDDGVNRIQSGLTTSLYAVESMRWHDEQGGSIGQDLQREGLPPITGQEKTEQDDAETDKSGEPVIASVLINVPALQSGKVVELLKERREIVFAAAIFGSYDVLAIIETERLDQIDEIIMDYIQGIEKVQATATSITIGKVQGVSEDGMRWRRRENGEIEHF